MPYDGLHIARGPKIKFDSYFQLEINLALICNDLKMPSSIVALVEESEANYTER